MSDNIKLQFTDKDLLARDSQGDTALRHVHSTEFERDQKEAKEKFLKETPLYTWKEKIQDRSLFDLAGEGKYESKLGSYRDQQRGISSEIVKMMKPVGKGEAPRSKEDESHVKYLLANVSDETLAAEAPNMDCSLRVAIVAMGYADSLSPEQLNSNHLKESDPYGKSVAHYLAEQGKLNLIKDNKIDADSMELQDIFGNNPIHAAYEAKTEKMLPKDYTVVGYAFTGLGEQPQKEEKSFKLKDIPAFVQKNKYGISPKDIHSEKAKDKDKELKDEPAIA
jgi:hypothetical protein